MNQRIIWKAHNRPEALLSNGERPFHQGLLPLLLAKMFGGGRHQRVRFDNASHSMLVQLQGSTAPSDPPWAEPPAPAVPWPTGDSPCNS